MQKERKRTKVSPNSGKSKPNTKTKNNLRPHCGTSVLPIAIQICSKAKSNEKEIKKQRS